MRIPDTLFQIADVRHVDVKHLSAALAHGVIMAVAEMIVAVRPAGNHHLADQSVLSQLIQVPVNGCPSDGGMVF